MNNKAQPSGYVEEFNPQLALLDVDPTWRDEWEGMPEFVQEKQAAFATLIVRFRSKEDLDEFAALIDQKLTPKTKSIWHPLLDRVDRSKDWRYYEKS